MEQLVALHFELGLYFLLSESLTQAPQSRAGCLASHCRDKSFIMYTKKGKKIGDISSTLF